MDTNDPTQQSHHIFSVAAHNRATDILYANEPTEAEVVSLIELAHVAHWHWQQRSDKTVQNVSVALWLLSRAYSANGLGAEALAYAERSLRTLDGSGLKPSFFGYAHEALARAHLLLGNVADAKHHVARAYEIAATVPAERAKQYLLDQLDRIQMPRVP